MNRLLLFVIIMLVANPGFAQLVETKVSPYIHDDKTVEAYQIVLDADKDDAKSYWNNFIQDEND